jgi:hypothetical protein
LGRFCGNPSLLCEVLISYFVRDSLKLKECRQLFVRVRNIAFAVVAVCVSNKDRLPVGIHG